MNNNGAPSGAQVASAGTEAHVRVRFPAPSLNWCKDLDNECPDVKCKLSCWLYDPARGLCPFLSTGST